MENKQNSDDWFQKHNHVTGWPHVPHQSNEAEARHRNKLIKNYERHFKD